MCIDIKDFYLNTLMKRAEYMRIPLNIILTNIINHYQLRNIAYNSNVYVEITKGIYGLPQSGRLANDALLVRLHDQGYYQCKRTPGLFTHETRTTQFSLVVNNFGVKYNNKEDIQHLIDTLSSDYQITTNWLGDTYLGMHRDWDYDACIRDISMPGYVEKALQRFEHIKPTKPERAPHASKPIVYGAKVQLTDEPDLSPTIEAHRVKRLQRVVGVCLYYARAIDSTMLVAVGTLASAQTRATFNTEIAITQLLDYAATNPNARLQFKASDMILNIHSDASYFSEA
jgi:hypothetical protein